MYIIHPKHQEHDPLNVQMGWNEISLAVLVFKPDAGQV